MTLLRAIDIAMVLLAWVRFVVTSDEAVKIHGFVVGSIEETTVGGERRCRKRRASAATCTSNNGSSSTVTRTCTDTVIPVHEIQTRYKIQETEGGNEHIALPACADESGNDCDDGETRTRIESESSVLSLSASSAVCNTDDTIGYNKTARAKEEVSRRLEFWSDSEDEEIPFEYEYARQIVRPLYNKDRYIVGRTSGWVGCNREASTCSEPSTFCEDSDEENVVDGQDDVRCMFHSDDDNMKAVVGGVGEAQWGCGTEWTADEIVPVVGAVGEAEYGCPSFDRPSTERTKLKRAMIGLGKLNACSLMERMRKGMKLMKNGKLMQRRNTKHNSRNREVVFRVPPLH